MQDENDMALKGVEGSITFFYYEDLAKAEEFYCGVMGFEKVIDVDFAKVFRVSGDAHVGIVDGQKGSMRPTKDKPVMLTVIVDDIEAWHRHLVERGVEIDQPPKEASYLRMKTLLFRDPEDYVIEVLEFLTKPYGT
jgi:predicted enzyme related to lactoylglutathione lyase